MSIEQRLKDLGIVLPPAAAPAANYVPYVIEGAWLFIAGQLPFENDGSLKHLGKLGGDLSVEQGYASARQCALNCLAQAQAALGSLDRVRRVVRVGGFVQCVDGFIQQPQVINGASDVIVEVLGDKGRHARAAVGNNVLPAGVATEVDMIVAVD